MRSSTTLRLSLALTLLLTGAFLYILFRSRNHLAFYAADALGLRNFIDSLRASVADVETPEFVRFNLPDCLWSTSYILIADFIFREESQWARLKWVSAIPLIGIGSELLQFAGLLPGVYDPLDLVAYFLPLGCYFIFTNLIKTNNKK